MRERRALRFLVEAIFLGALAAALVFTDLSPLAIAGVMLAGWLVVALYEWAATRELPHYGRGLPPRYYVPQVSLPPPRQLEQLRTAYPRADLEDEATWIATPAMRAEALAEWSVVDGPEAAVEPAPIEDTIVVALPPVGAWDEPFHEDTWIALDPVAEGRSHEDEPAVAVAEPEAGEEVEAEVEPEPEVVAIVAEPEPVMELDVAEAPVVEAIVAAETDLLDAPVVEPEAEVVESEVEPAPEAVLVASEPEVLDVPVAEPEAAVVEPEVAAEGEAEPAEPFEWAEGEPPAAEVALAQPEPLGEPEEAEPDPVLEPVVAAAVVTESEPREEDGPDAEPEPGLDVGAAAALAGAAAVAEPAIEAEVEPEPEREPVSALAVSAAVVGAAVLADRVADAEQHAEPDRAGPAVVGAEPEDDDDTAEDAVQQKAPAPMRPSRHTFDPLGDDAHPRRRFRRRSRDEPYVELPAGAPRPTALPGASRREE